LSTETWILNAAERERVAEKKKQEKMEEALRHSREAEKWDKEEEARIAFMGRNTHTPDSKNTDLFPVTCGAQTRRAVKPCIFSKS
jgi:ADP-ribosylglycohydrolase